MAFAQSLALVPVVIDDMIRLVHPMAIILAPSYSNTIIAHAGSSPFHGSTPHGILIDLAPNELTLIVQAPVLATSVLNESCIPVV